MIINGAAEIKSGLEARTRMTIMIMTITGAAEMKNGLEAGTRMTEMKIKSFKVPSFHFIWATWNVISSVLPKYSIHSPSLPAASLLCPVPLFCFY